MISTSGDEMREREFLRSRGSDPGRRPPSHKRRADGALCLQEPLPDPVRRGIAQAALEIAEGLQLIAAGHGLLEKGPQGVGGQEQTSDPVRQPDAEGSSATARPSAIAAINPPRADRWLMLVRSRRNRAKTHGGSGSPRACNADRPSSSTRPAPPRIPPAIRKPARPQPAPQASSPRRAILGSSTTQQSPTRKEAGYNVFDKRRGSGLQRLRKRAAGLPIAGGERLLELRL